MVLIVVLIPSSVTLFSLKILSLLLLQTVYTLYAIYLRSFEKNKDQVVEVSNELVYFILIILLIRLYAESKWTDIAVYLYIGIILSQLLVLFIVSIVNGVISLIKLIKNFSTSNDINNCEEFQSENNSEKESNGENRNLPMNDQLNSN